MRAREISQRYTDQEPTTPHQIGHWDTERDFTTAIVNQTCRRPCMGGSALLGRPVCDMVTTRLTTNPFLCRNNTNTTLVYNTLHFTRGRRCHITARPRFGSLSLAGRAEQPATSPLTRKSAISLAAGPGFRHSSTQQPTSPAHHPRRAEQQMGFGRMDELDGGG